MEVKTMPLVAAKCTNCGASLEIDNRQEAAICKYCNSAFIVEKAIHNYNTYNQNQYHIQNAQLIVEDHNSIEKQLENAETFFLKHKDKEKAHVYFNNVAYYAPDDYRGWWGLARISTDDFSNYTINKKEFDRVCGLKNRALNVASEDVAKELKYTWSSFIRGISEYNEKMAEEIARLQGLIGEIEIDLEEPRKQREEFEGKIKKASRKLKSIDAGSYTRGEAVFFITIPATILLLLSVFAVPNKIIATLSFSALSITLLLYFISKNKEKKLRKVTIPNLESKRNEFNAFIYDKRELQKKYQAQMDRIKASCVVLEDDIL